MRRFAYVFLLASSFVAWRYVVTGGASFAGQFADENGDISGDL